MGLKQLVILIICILCILPVLSFADECSYKFPVTRTVAKEHLICQGTVIDDALELRNIQQINQTNPCWLSFEIYNKEQYAVKATIRYSVLITNSSGTSTKEDVYYGNVIESQKAKRLNVYEDTATSCELINNSVTFIYQSYQNTSLSTKKEPETTLECIPCNSIECSSKLCYQGYCIQTCPDGMASCNGICVSVGTIKQNQPYTCDFECKTHIGDGKTCVDCKSNQDCNTGLCNTDTGTCTECFNGICKCDYLGPNYSPCNNNQSCVVPSTKQNGVAALCQEECISDTMENNVCKPSNKEKLISWGIIALIFVVVVLIVYLLYKNNSLQKEINKKQKKKTELDNTINDIVTNLTQVVASRTKEKEDKITSESNKKIEKALAQMKEVSAQHQQIIEDKKQAIIEKEEAENLAKEAKKNLDNERKKLKKQEEDLIEQRQENKKLEIDIKNQQTDIQKLRTELEDANREYLDKNKEYVQDCLVPRPSQYANGHQVIRNPKYSFYDCFYHPEIKRFEDYPPKHLVHRWRAEKYLWEKHRDFYEKTYGDIDFESMQVHHIDGDKYNNSTENLAIISKEEHRLLHRKHKIYDLKSGQLALEDEGIELPN